MPGQPRTAALVAHLREEVEGRARVEHLLDLIADGQMIKEVARGVTLVYAGEAWTPDRRTLSAALHREWPRELAQAKNDAGEPNAEAALEVLKNAPETKEGIAKARELASMYRWLASKRDPANFGDAPATAIQINNPGQRFLQGAARPGAVPPKKTPAALPGDASGVRTVPKDETDDGEVAEE